MEVGGGATSGAEDEGAEQPCGPTTGVGLVGLVGAERRTRSNQGLIGAEDEWVEQPSNLTMI